MPAVDLHPLGEGLSGPCDNAEVVVPHATNELATVSRALYVGGSGDIVAAMWGGGSDVTFKNVPAGTVLPIRIKAVRATGTTATFMLALA